MFTALIVAALSATQPELPRTYVSLGNGREVEVPAGQHPLAYLRTRRDLSGAEQAIAVLERMYAPARK